MESLSTTCIQSTALLEAAVSDCSLPLWHLKCDADRHVLVLVEQLMDQITRCFDACFGGLNMLCGTILGRKSKFDVVDRMVSFFSKSLDHLHTICSIQMEHEGETSRQRGRRCDTEGQTLHDSTPGHQTKRARMNGKGSEDTGKSILADSPITGSAADLHTIRVCNQQIFNKSTRINDTYAVESWTAWP